MILEILSFMFKKIEKVFDKLEDGARGWLSRHPILYAFVGGAGVVIFWRGIWHTTDYITYLFVTSRGNNSISLAQEVWWDGPLSILFGSLILLITGVMVSSFIGNELIISGIRKEKKIAEKTEEELTGEHEIVDKIRKDIAEIKRKIK